jgi:hypothetical protein
MQVQNVSFKGYQNVIATKAKFINADVSFISAKLNNRGYFNDLDIWKSLQKNLFSDKKTTDIFTFMHIKNHDDKESCLFLNERVLAPAKDIFLISKEEEKPMIKTFILLKSIAERIMGGEKGEVDFSVGVKEMLPHNVEILKKVIAEPSAAAELLADAVFPLEGKNEAVAAHFYNAIDDYMDGYVDHLEQRGM